MARSVDRSSATVCVGIPDIAFARTISRIKRMTRKEGIQSLKDAGILTRKGNYTKPYRMLGSTASH
jgi:hypothetical protein